MALWCSPVFAAVTKRNPLKTNAVTREGRLCRKGGQRNRQEAAIVRSFLGVRRESCLRRKTRRRVRDNTLQTLTKALKKAHNVRGRFVWLETGGLHRFRLAFNPTLKTP